MKTTKYDEEELEILEHIESWKYKSIENKDKELEKFSFLAKENLSKRKTINIRPLESDIRKIKIMAIEKGLPYQTFINSVIHQVANEKIKIN